MKLDIGKIHFDFLKEQYPIEKGFFLVPEVLLKLNALWPYYKSSLLLFFLNILNSTSLIGAGMLIFKAASQIFANDQLEALDPVGPGMSFTITGIKYLYFWYYKSDYRNIIDECRELLFTGKSEQKLK